MLVRCRLHRRDLEGVYLIMMVPDRDIFAELERMCAEPIASFVVVSGSFVVKHPTCMLRSTGFENKAAILVLFAAPKSVDAAMLTVLLLGRRSKLRLMRHVGTVIDPRRNRGPPWINERKPLISSK
jgi:hypothetical protein